MLFSEILLFLLLIEVDFIVLMEKYGIGTDCLLYVDKWSLFKKICLDVGELVFFLI